MVLPDLSISCEKNFIGAATLSFNIFVHLTASSSSAADPNWPLSSINSDLHTQNYFKQPCSRQMQRDWDEKAGTPLT